MSDRFTFREGTCDRNVFENVVDRNEYRLPDRFTPEDVIIDVGSHIGSFAWACIQRGAKRVICFEPEPENFAAIRRHLLPEIQAGIVVPFMLAVGSRGFEIREHSGHTAIGSEVNTGGGFIYGRDGEAYVKPEYIVNRSIFVPKVGLDQIVDALGIDSVRFLKLDCEHSEWELLRDACSIHRVTEIAGEYHSFDHFTPDWMSAFLTTAGFNEVIITPHAGSPLGMFFAKRR